MKKINFKIQYLLLSISFGLLLFIGSCAKDSSNSTVNPSDEYYVKYEIVSSATPYNGWKINTTYTNEKNEPSYLTHNTGTWEATIGPVKAGFRSSLYTVKNGWTSGEDYFLKLALKISTSKNGGPFAVKQYDNLTTTRPKASLTYTVE